MTPRRMTLSGKVMFGLHGLVLIGTVRASSRAIEAGIWELAATLLGIAAVALASLLREISRAELNEHERKNPPLLTRMKARRAAKRLSPQRCCETWWETLGEAHDATCWAGSPRRSNYLAQEDE